MVNSQVHIYLVQPIDKAAHKEIIVYADNERQARTAAATLARDSKTGQANVNGDDIESVYLNNGESICIEIEPKIITVDTRSEQARIKYNEVIYDLKKRVAEEVIAENIL